MIGILLALQVNNWNEQRKDRRLEISQLKNIQEDILSDTSDVSYNITYHKLCLKSINELLDYLSSPEWKPKVAIDYENALGTPLILILHESAFSNLKDNNLNIISNKALLKKISNHYDFYAKVLLRIENDMEETKTYTILEPYFLKYFHYENKSNTYSNTEYNNADYYSPDFELNKLVLIDTLGVKKDEAFRIELAEAIRFIELKISYYEDFLQRIHKLDKDLGEELKKLNN